MTAAGGACGRRRRHRRPLWGHGMMADERGACRRGLDGCRRWDREFVLRILRRRWWSVRVLLARAHRSDGIDELHSIPRGDKVDLKATVRLHGHTVCH